MRPRHEWKHEIDLGDVLVLRQRLGAILRPDSHGRQGEDRIRSLYFDNLENRALREKLDGVDRREKFRLRCYDTDTSFIRLEKKSKRNGLCYKQSDRMSAQEVERLLQGDLVWMGRSDRPLVRELYYKMTTQGLRPRTLVDYRRKAYVYPAGNVRVTLDDDLRTGLGGVDLLDPQLPLVRAGDAPTLLEVKWDEFLPDCVRMAVQLPNRRAGAFSKYAACRVYG